MWEGGLRVWRKQFWFVVAMPEFLSSFLRSGENALGFDGL